MPFGSLTDVNDCQASCHQVVPVSPLVLVTLFLNQLVQFVPLCDRQRVDEILQAERGQVLALEESDDVRGGVQPPSSIFLHGFLGRS